MCSRCLVARLRGVMVALVLVITAQRASAQVVAPSAANEVSVGEGAGLTSPITPTGGYSASVPISLPSPRGHFTPPLAIVYTGGTHVGAAGAGWDIPLSFVHRSASTWHRKPAAASTSANPDFVPERITVSLDGQSTTMVPSTTPDVYLPFIGDQYMELRRYHAGPITAFWILYAASGVEYEFVPASSVGDGSFRDDDTWLLTGIRDTVSGDRLDLRYETPLYAATPGENQKHELDLSEISYTYADTAAGRVPLYDVTLSYRGAAHDGSPQLVAFTDTGALPYPRTRILDHLTVNARNNLDASEPPHEVQQYQFEYDTDPDLGLERLSDVSVFGEGPTSASLPVATYTYGAVTTAADEVVHLSPTKTVSVASGLLSHISGISGSASMRESLPADPSCSWSQLGGPLCNEGSLETTRSTYTIRDFTGDGIADLVYFDEGDDRWHVEAGRATDDGPVIDGGGSFSWSPGDDGPEGIYEQRTLDDPSARDQGTITATVTEFIDWNGDGRVDVLTSDTGTTTWRVWLNLPGTPLSWSSPVDIDVSAARAAVGDEAIDSTYLPLFPLEQSRSWPRMVAFQCGHYYPNASSVIGDGTPCADPTVFVTSNSSDTIAQWQILDANGDSYPDVVTSSEPVRACDTETGAPLPYTSACHTESVNGQDVYACGSVIGAQWLSANGTCDFAVTPTPEALVVYNRAGALLNVVAQDYPPAALANIHDGLAAWTDVAPGTSAAGIDLDPDQSSETWGFADAHARGIPGYSSGGGLQRFESDRSQVCPFREDSGGTFHSVQTEGLADLNGDGFPDLIKRAATSSNQAWQVEFGNSAGFGPPRTIDTGGLGFAPSRAEGDCDGVTDTTVGLLDLDGDGKPELVWRLADGLLHYATIEVREDGALVDGVSAGRLTSINNGYGATTKIRYANNKTSNSAGHQVPAPEIVVAETQTLLGGWAPDGAPTRYGYATPEMRYDPVFGRLSFAGYRRTVALSLSGPSVRTVEGVALIVDHAPQAPFGSSFADYAMGGRVERTTRLEGTFAADMDNLLGVDTTDTAGHFPDARARAQRRVTYGVTPLLAAGVDTGLGYLECVDVDIDHAAPALTVAICAGSAIVGVRSTLSWEGMPASPADRVTEVSTIDAVDDRGRPTSVHEFGDVTRSDDDTCSIVEYAETDATALPALGVVSAVHTTDCGQRSAGSGGPAIVLAGTRYVYDGLPEGQVSRGLVTSEVVEDYDVSDGSLLDEFVAMELSYNAHGEVAETTETRQLGAAASRVTDLDYDDFGVTTTSVTTDASDVLAGPFVRQQTSSTWPSREKVTIGLNGEQTSTTRDRFGRPVAVTITPQPGQSPFTVFTRAYDDDQLGREITETSYPESAARPQRSHVHLDALGRPMFRQTELGADYSNSTLVTDLVEYDALGRPVYQAAPFEWATLPFSPDDLSADPLALPYGVSTVYDDAGRVIRQVEGPGHRDAATTSVPDHVYVTSVGYSWSAGRAITRSYGPRDNDPTSAAFLYSDQASVTAIGWAVENTRMAPNGTRLDLVRRGYDRLGHETLVERFKDPAAAGGAADWTMTYDSAGRVLTEQEPGTSLVENAYDEWGDLLETSWVDRTTTTRLQRRAYDGLGRQTQLDLVDRDVASGLETIDSSEHSFFDEPSGSPDQVDGLLLGRLSYTEATGVGDAYFGYDALGHTTSESYVFVGVPQRMRTSRVFAPGGALTELDFDTPAGLDRIGYSLDSAARTTTVRDLVANRALFTSQQLDAKGRYHKVLLGNGVKETNEFAPDGREELVHQGFQTGSGVRNHNLGARDADGRLLDEVWTGNGSQHFVDEYDRMGRLGRQAQPGQDERFTYDGLGNITRKVNVNVTAQNRDYSYWDEVDPDLLCIVAVPGAPGSTLRPRCDNAYDGAGNTVADTWTGTIRARSFAYDPASRITSIQKGTATATFLYGPGGSLAREDLYNGTTLDHRTWTFGSMIEQRTRPDGHTEVDRRVPGPEGLIATLRTEGSNRETIYVHGDARGNRFFTKQDGKVSQEARYRAYGEVIADTGSPSLLPYSDDLWNGGDDLHQLGVDLLGARVYDPSLGRFLQRDPIATMVSSSTGSPYAFAFGDPVDLADPTGLAPWLCVSWGPGGCSSSLNSAGAGSTSFVGSLAATLLAFGLEELGSGLDPAPQNATAINWGTAGSAHLESTDSVDWRTVAKGVYFGVPGSGDLIDFAADAMTSGVSTAVSNQVSSTQDKAYNATVKPFVDLPDALRAEADAASRGDFVGFIANQHRAGIDAAQIYGVASGAAEVSGEISGAADVAGGSRAVPTGGEPTVLPGGTGQAFAGHGSYTPLFGETVIPEGTTLTVPTALGTSVPEGMGQALERGDWEAIANNPDWAARTEGAQSYLPGARVPNLLLRSADAGMTVFENSIRVTGEDSVVLEDLIKPDMGHMCWAACSLPLL